MRFDIITLFPEMFESFMASGVTRRAFDSGQVQVRLWSPRDHAAGNYRRVDDRPFGGGPGMVMMAEPLWLCLQAIRTDRQQDRTQAPLLFFAPHGQVLSHAVVSRWSASESGAVLLCGRYEGVDQRFIDAHVDGHISLGDLCCRGAKSRPWPSWMPWRGCNLAFCMIRTATPTTVSTPFWTDCSTAPISPGLRSGMANLCLRHFYRATTATFSAGAENKACVRRRSCAQT